MSPQSIIDFLATQPLTALVKPADEQYEDGKTACFCPFCQRGYAGQAANGGKRVAGTPHFIIYNDVYGGLYGGRGAQRWMCSRTQRSGYGALELYAAIHGLTLEGESLRKAAIGLLTQLGYKEEDVRKKFPTEHPYVPVLALTEQQEQQTFTFEPMAELTPQAVRALGCEVWKDKGVVRLSFGEDFSKKALRRDFNTVPVYRATLPTFVRNGQRVTETWYSTPWNPLFVTFATPDRTTGALWMPAINSQLSTFNFQLSTPIVFSLTDDHTVAKVSKWLGGDRLFTYCVEHRTTTNTAVAQGCIEMDEGEEPVTEREDWVEVIDEKGRGRMEIQTITIPTSEQKMENVILCDTPQDAICTYYTLRHHLKQLAVNNEQLAVNNEQLTVNNEQLTVNNGNTDSLPQREGWGGAIHVAFLLGRGKFWYLDHGEWKQDKVVEFGKVQYNKLTRFAHRVIILYPNSRKAQNTAFNIAKCFRTMSLAQLPESFREESRRKTQWLYGHTPDSVRDFILTYTMSPTEAPQYHRSLAEYFHRAVITRALPTCPLDREIKRDRQGYPKRGKGSIAYNVNMATVWQYMMCEGYCRAVDYKTNDRIGKYIRRQGCFVDELNEKSMVAATIDALYAYAAAEHTNNDDYALMLEGINRCKEINVNSIARLPATQLNWQFSGPNHTHFFFQNKAWRITKDSISLISYDDIEFDIPRAALLPWSTNIPSGKAPAITINPEAASRRQQISDARKATMADGKTPQYTIRQISQMEADYVQWASTYLYHVEWPETPWQSVQVLRGMANMRWEMEQEYLRSEQPVPEYDQSLLSAHFANILFAVGMAVWGYRGSVKECASYILENSVTDNNEAQGGTGKSTLVKIFMGCACYYCNIDAKELVQQDNMRFALSEYRPHIDRFVHWEDTPQSFPITGLYNMIGGALVSQKKGIDKETQDVMDSPAHVITSNYPVPNSDDSTQRRLVLVPISDRFGGANIMKNRPARKISTIMPGLSRKSEDLPPQIRNQFTFLCALGAQLAMRAEDVVNAPMEDVKRRQMVRELTDAFVRWADYFFSLPNIWCDPQDLNSMWDEYKFDFTDSSEEKKGKFSLKTFKQKCQKYCEYNNIIMNPAHLFERKKDIQQGYFHLDCWCTKQYFTERDWENDDTVSVKTIRILRRSEHAVVFYRQTDKVPASYDELLERYKIFRTEPDPMPIRDSDGNIVALTEDEHARLTRYYARRQGGNTATPLPTPLPATPTNTQHLTPNTPQDPFVQAANTNMDDVPF